MKKQSSKFSKTLVQNTHEEQIFQIFYRNTWESIGILGSIGIPGNFEAGNGHLGSHRNTSESIGILGSISSEHP